MRIDLLDVAKGKKNEALPPLSASFESGRVRFVEVETERRPTVLGLIATGRMTPDTGSVLLDGEPDASRMRASIALVDAPIVSEPAASVTLSGVVAEELMFAGHASGPAAVSRTLEALRLTDHARSAITDVPPADRIRALCELALLRDGVEGIVLTSPDRHGGDPTAWWALAREIADRGIAVLVIAGRASALALRDEIDAEAAEAEARAAEAAEAADADSPSTTDPDTTDPEQIGGEAR